MSEDESDKDKNKGIQEEPIDERPYSDEYQDEYSDDGFWEKVKVYASAAGYEVIEKSLWIYYAAQKPDTPAWAKTTVYGALGYFISPVDAIPDLTPVVGYADDLGVLVLAVAAVASYIDDGVKKLSEDKLTSWFGVLNKTNNDDK